MPRKKKEPPLPEMTPARTAIFDRFNVDQDTRLRWHRRLCTATTEEKQKAAIENELPISEDEEAWLNQILILHYERMKRVCAALDHALGEADKMQRYFKAKVMKVPHERAILLLD